MMAQIRTKRYEDEVKAADDHDKGRNIDLHDQKLMMSMMDGRTTFDQCIQTSRDEF